MVTISTILLLSDNKPVKFLLKPTVPYAEKHSKAILSSGSVGLNTDTKNMEIPRIINDRKIMANALKEEL